MIKQPKDRYSPNRSINNKVNVLDIEQQPSDPIKRQEEDPQALPRNIEDELQLNLEKYSLEIKNEVKYLLLDLLKYPSTEQAEQHRCANRLGYSDLKNIKNKQVGDSMFNPSTHRPHHCKDCNLLIQQREIPLCSQIWEFPTAGMATFKFFQTIKLLWTFIFILGVIFSIQSLYFNIIEPTQVVSITNFPKKFAYSGKLLYYSNNYILFLLIMLDACLLMLTVIIWWASLYCMRCCREKYHRMVDQQSLSACDFTIMLEHLPIHYNKDTLQIQLNRYFQSLVYKHNIKNTWGEQLKPFTIDKICKTVPFALSEQEVLDQQLQGLDEDILEKKKLFANWLIEIKQNSRFSSPKATREKQYANFLKMRERRNTKIQEMENRAREHYNTKIKDQTTTMFVTFAYNQSVSIIEDLNPQNIPAKIRYLISCFRSAHYFKIRDQRTNEEIDIRATRAPDPEDIIWGNVELPTLTIVVRKLIVWGVLLALVGVTFGIVYGLTAWQILQTTNPYISVLIALTITLMNMLIRFVACKLSLYEKDFTQTSRQSSIVIKSTIVCMLNWILCPMITNLIVESFNMYGSQGMVYDIFFLAITNALIPPLLRIFNPMTLIRKLKALWKNRPYKKMLLKQSELNEYLGNQQCEYGWSYAYFLDLFYFTLFYQPMHPSITISALIGVFCMYWAEKYILLRRSERPATNAALLNQTVNLMVALGPIVLAIGGILWVDIVMGDNSSMVFIVYMCLLSVGVLFFLHPYHSLYNCCCHVPEEELLSFNECKSKLKTDYDIINPATIKEPRFDIANKFNTEQNMVSLNRSDGDLLQSYAVYKMVDQMTKLPNIFGRKNDISKKIQMQEMPNSSRVRKYNMEVQKLSRVQRQEVELFVSPQKEIIVPMKEINVSQDKFSEKEELSAAQTEKKPIMNYNSSGVAYSKRKRTEIRKVVSVLQHGSKQYKLANEK